MNELFTDRSYLTSREKNRPGTMFASFNGLYCPYPYTLSIALQNHRRYPYGFFPPFLPPTLPKQLSPTVDAFTPMAMTTQPARETVSSSSSTNNSRNLKFGIEEILYGSSRKEEASIPGPSSNLEITTLRQSSGANPSSPRMSSQCRCTVCTTGKSSEQKSDKSKKTEEKAPSSSAEIKSGKRRKRHWSRPVFSQFQRRGLEKRFQVQQYVTKSDRYQLASALGLSEAQVKVWFQNRRTKWRKFNSAKYLNLSSCEMEENEFRQNPMMMDNQPDLNDEEDGDPRWTKIGLTDDESEEEDTRASVKQPKGEHKHHDWEGKEQANGCSQREKFIPVKEKSSRRMYGDEMNRENICNGCQNQNKGKTYCIENELVQNIHNSGSKSGTINPWWCKTNILFQREKSKAQSDEHDSDLSEEIEVC